MLQAKLNMKMNCEKPSRIALIVMNWFSTRKCSQVLYIVESK